MASSGTVPSTFRDFQGSIGIVTDFKLKSRPREEVMVAGRVRMKSSGTLEAKDFGLKTIKALSLTPYHSHDAAGAVGVMVYGSINTGGSPSNFAYYRSLKGSQAAMSSGTAHMGTIPAGTLQLSFTAIGA